MTVGIYKITNKTNGKIYIGQSINIEERWKQHKKDFHRIDCSLYRAFRKYGVENFNFEIIEELVSDKELLLTRERYYVETLNTLRDGYNDILPEMAIGTLNRVLNEDEVKSIRKRKFDGESWNSVYQDFKNKLKEGGFLSVWNGTRYSDIAMEDYTKENLSQLHSQNLQGEKNPKAKLTEKDVVDIRTRKKKGEAFRFVFKDYKDKISYGGLRQVWGGQSWKHVQV